MRYALCELAHINRL